ncbi:MAG TPA: DUF222 domain-containing protein [Intrasporangium sp.]|nr:DUF222 domain-containing protein [Intrasporangium sp.]
MSTGQASSGGVAPGVPALAAVSDEARVDLPGLPARLASMAAELRLIARNYPLTSLARAGIGDAIEQAQAIREMAHSLTALLAAEVEARDIASASGLSRNDWVTAHAPTLAGGPSAAVTAVGAALAGDDGERWKQLGRKVIHGETTVDKAAIIVRFHNDVVRVADREQLDPIVDSLVEHSQVLGTKELRQLVAQARVALKPPKDVEAEEIRLRAGRVLTKIGRVAGLVEYRLRLDPEGAAILDAAIDPLARPRPDLDWNAFRDVVPADTSGGSSVGPPRRDGADESTEIESTRDESTEDEPDASRDCGGIDVTESLKGQDPRSAATRRADALLELIGRAVAAPEGVTRTPRTQLVVTMTLEALLEQVRGTAVADNGEALSAATVRRLACEAGITPAVLGAPSEPLDLGHWERYFTRAQRRALALRDKGCTWPGCSIPYQWCEAHHAEHWANGGLTDLSNGTLICGRHHTLAHQLGLLPSITPTGVRWLRVPDRPGEPLGDPPGDPPGGPPLRLTG